MDRVRGRASSRHPRDSVSSWACSFELDLMVRVCIRRVAAGIGDVAAQPHGAADHVGFAIHRLSEFMFLMLGETVLQIIVGDHAMESTRRSTGYSTEAAPFPSSCCGPRGCRTPPTVTPTAATPSPGCRTRYSARSRPSPSSSSALASSSLCTTLTSTRPTAPPSSNAGSCRPRRSRVSRCAAGRVARRGFRARTPRSPTPPPRRPRRRLLGFAAIGGPCRRRRFALLGGARRLVFCAETEMMAMLRWSRSAARLPRRRHGVWLAAAAMKFARRCECDVANGRRNFTSGSRALARTRSSPCTWRARAARRSRPPRRRARCASS